MRRVKTLQEVVKTWMKKSGKQNLFHELRIKEEWKDLLGDRINEKTEQITWVYKDEIVLIKMGDALLKNELNYAKRSIQEKLNERIPEIEIQKILII